MRLEGWRVGKVLYGKHCGSLDLGSRVSEPGLLGREN